jgi:hypothetical protein
MNVWNGNRGGQEEALTQHCRPDLRDQILGNAWSGQGSEIDLLPPR